MNPHNCFPCLWCFTRKTKVRCATRLAWFLCEWLWNFPSASLSAATIDESSIVTANKSRECNIAIKSDWFMMAKRFRRVHKKEEYTARRRKIDLQSWCSNHLRCVVFAFLPPIDIQWLPYDIISSWNNNFSAYVHSEGGGRKCGEASTHKKNKRLV